jgi:hypothetical protein
MKTVFTLFLSTCLLISITCVSQTSLPKNVSRDWFNSAADYARQIEYNFYTTNNGFRTTNSATGIGFLIHKHGYTAFNLKGTNKGEWEVEMLLHSISRSTSTIEFPVTGNISKTNKGLVHSFGFADVEYINNESGLRQNFIINERPIGKGRLNVNLHTQSSLTKLLINQNKLVFFRSADPKSILLSYEDLKVWDATHKRLEAHMEWNDKANILSLVIDDKDAVYPVTVDPLNQSSEWSSSANGILTGLSTTSLQVNALYGHTVANLGDINNDGYDDVAVGAPGMANVVTGTGTTAGVGAVFIYMGSDTGLADIPNKILQPAAASAGASFGYSIVAGNISPDGNKNDIIVGAPMDTYETTVPDIIGSQQVDVPAGSVFYFRSEDLDTSSNPLPQTKIRLQGGNFFSDGILGLANNLTNKGLFGFSVAISSDLNGDSRQDVLIGSPNYTSTSLLAAQQGSAFVYYSNNLATTTPVVLSAPAPALFGISGLALGNLDGLLFGFSVEGVGDYNNDGIPDVAVSAPAGADLSSLGGILTGQFLGGSAYIYYGNGAGVNTAIGAKLQAASGGLFSSAANLFGYKIKAVTNVAGAKNGNILISAVNGSVLSNVIGGLQLKAGEVHLFKKKTAAFTSPVTSEQTLVSPRAAAVTSLLTGESQDVSLLFGASMDNMRDANCDGSADIIVGEPLSSNVPLVGANVTGGSAYIYLGQPDGTYQATPVWTLETTVAPLLGVNSTSLIGYTVAGGVRTHGINSDFRTIIGGPSNALDFGGGALDLGGTLGVMNSFTFDNNGLGKTYSFNPNLCGLISLPVAFIDLKGQVTDKTILVNWVAEVELEVNMYQLQRSTDGEHFENVAIVFSKNGMRSEYNYPDRHPAKGANYYRLMIVNNDNTATYSKTIVFRFNEQLPGFMVVAPNPVHGPIRVKFAGFDKGDYIMRVYNTNGQLVAMKRINLTQHDQVEEIQRSAELQPGAYWINLSDREKIVRTVNLVIGD